MNLSDRLVLIVDDSPANQRLARDVLRAAGYRTVEAGTAGDGIALAREQLPDLILMDLRLPDRDGTEAARVLRADPLTSAIPIVGLSALPLEPGDDWLADAGFAGYVTKPFDVDELPDLVRRYCGRDPA